MEVRKMTSTKYITFYKFVAFFFILLVSSANATAFSWLLKTGTKHAEKTALKQEQIQVNRITGNILDDAFKQKWCQTHKCGTNVDELRKTLKSADTVYITSDWEVKKYINEKFDPSFTRRPDMLEVNVANRNIKNIKIYDTKTSADAIISADARGQGGDYEKLCNTLNVKYGGSFCSVQYVLPKDEVTNAAKKTGGDVLGCLIIGLIMVPDPTDVLCLLVT